MRVVPRSAPTALVTAVGAAEYNLSATTEQEQSFAALYELRSPRLVDFAERFLGRDGAYDAVQQAAHDFWSRRWFITTGRPPIPVFCRAVGN